MKRIADRIRTPISYYDQNIQESNLNNCKPIRYEDGKIRNIESRGKEFKERQKNIHERMAFVKKTHQKLKIKNQNRKDLIIKDEINSRLKSFVIFLFKHNRVLQFLCTIINPLKMSVLQNQIYLTF